jgi:hypothetical protein
MDVCKADKKTDSGLIRDVILKNKYSRKTSENK